MIIEFFSKHYDITTCVDSGQGYISSYDGSTCTDSTQRHFILFVFDIELFILFYFTNFVLFHFYSLFIRVGFNYSLH